MVAVSGGWVVGASTAVETSRSGPVVRDAWVRESTRSRTTTSAYVTLDNRTAVETRLVGVTVVGARRAEIHTVAEEQGRTIMQKVNSIRLPARSSVELAPGGTHIMLFDVEPPFVRGGTVTMTFAFNDAQKATVQAIVRPLDAASVR